MSTLTPLTASRPDTLIDSLIEKHTQRKQPKFEFESDPRFKTESVVLMQFGMFEPADFPDWTLFKLKFAVEDKHGKSMLDVVFNSDFGLRVINHTVKSPNKHDHYVDVDLDFRRSTKRMFLILHEGRIYLTVNGLSFADVIFTDAFNDPFAGLTSFRVVVDKEYTTPSFLKDVKFSVLSDSISQNLDGQLNVISNQSSDRIDLTAKLFFRTQYKDGSMCDATNQPRSTKVVYYCDQYSQRGSRVDMKVLDISEPDFCTYQIKLATKYLCSAGSQLPKISAKFDHGRHELKDKKLAALDAEQKTQRRKVDCRIKSDF